MSMESRYKIKRRGTIGGFLLIILLTGIIIMCSFGTLEKKEYGLEYEIRDGYINLSWNSLNNSNDYYLTILQDGIQLSAFWVTGTNYSILDNFDGDIVTFKVAVSGEMGATIDYVKRYNTQPVLLNPYGVIHGRDVMFCWDTIYLADSYDLVIATREDEIVKQVTVSNGKTSTKVCDLKPGLYKWTTIPKTKDGLRGIEGEWAYFEILEAEQPVENVFGIEKEGVLSMLNTPLTYPETAVVGPDDALYVSDSHANVIRRCKDGVSEIYVGTLVAGKSEREIRNKFAINLPSDIIFDDEGNMYFSDNGNHRICKVEKDTGQVYSVWNHGEIVKKFYIENDGSLTILCIGKVINSISGEVCFEGCELGNLVGLIRNGNKTILLDAGYRDIEPKLVLYVNEEFQKSISVVGFSSALWLDKNNDIYLGEHTIISKLNWELEREKQMGDYANVSYITQGKEDFLLVTDSDSGGGISCK
ncbi:MAG: hypothetical protein HFH88_01060 [Lachnospiraceae bacterium]|nr:hypothetical protein [Lachnospiraceae bacterium]